MALKEPHKKRVNFEELDLEGVDDYWEYKGEAYTGYGTENAFLPSDNATFDVSFEDEYRDGFRVGWSREYYPNGHVKHESLDFFDTPMLTINYNDQGIETHRFLSVGQDFYDDVIASYNVLDK